MLIKNTVFYKDQWIWSNFLQYLVSKLDDYGCLKYDIPLDFLHKQANYGPRKEKKIVRLSTWGVFCNRINLARAVCIESPQYSVLNFLIIPNPCFNMPFFGVDFVSLPNMYLIVLDFQPSIKIEKQFDTKLLNQLIKLKQLCNNAIPFADKMSDEVQSFFSPGLIWSKLSKVRSSKLLIEDQLYYYFKEYLNLYLDTLFKIDKVDNYLKNEIMYGQNNYLEYRKNKDPARPMLKVLFGEDYTEALINDVLFSVR